MADLTSFAAMLSSLKTATDIAKLIRESAVTLEQAELKMKFADLITALADVKIEVAELQSVLRDKDELIKSLQAQLIVKDSLRFDGKLYWLENDETPLCAICYEKDNRLIHLTYYAGNEFSAKHYTCKVCHNKYQQK